MERGRKMAVLCETRLGLEYEFPYQAGYGQNTAWKLGTRREHGIISEHGWNSVSQKIFYLA